MPRPTRLTGKKLGELLVESGLIDEPKLSQALTEQKGTGELLGEVLVRLGFASEADIAATLAKQFALPFISVSQYYVSKAVAAQFDPKTLSTYQCVPLDKIGKVVIMAVSGPLDPEVIAGFEKATGCEIFLYVSTLSEIEKGLESLATGAPEKGGKK